MCREKDSPKLKLTLTLCIIALHGTATALCCMHTTEASNHTLCFGFAGLTALQMQVRSVVLCECQTITVGATTMLSCTCQMHAVTILPSRKMCLKHQVQTSNVSVYSRRQAAYLDTTTPASSEVIDQAVKFALQLSKQQP